MSRETAFQILESGTTLEDQLRRAELYLYLDRTKVLEAANPEPVIEKQKVDTVWLMLESTGGGSWDVRAVYTDEQAAMREYAMLSQLAAGTSGYWEVDCKELPVTS